MNVYDFDKTIYKKDSSIELYLYIIKRKPSIFFRCIPIQIKAGIFYGFRKISKESYKEKFFCFLNYIDIEKILDEFVEKEEDNIAMWYLNQKAKDDVIVSASPEFLVKAFARRLEIENVIASKVNQKTGKFYGKNCYGEEKVSRFQKEYALKEIEKFYSDSLSDKPMAENARQAYLVKKNQVVEWKMNT